MQVLIISDIHANLAALRALPRADAIICAGDIVGFGPDSSAVIDELRKLDALCVRGDEDDAIAKGSAHPAPPSLTSAAKELRTLTRQSLSDSQMDWLRSLPPERELVFDGVRIGVTHAYPGDYGRYIKPTDEEIKRMERAFPHCDIVVVGHTHRQGTWSQRGLVVNPGSAGQPERAGFAAYAILENGSITFGEARYDPLDTIAALSALGVSERVYGECVQELVEGSTRPFARLAHVG